MDTLADRLEEFEYTLSDDRQYLVIDMEEPESSDYDDDWAGGDGDGVWLADDQMDNPNNDDGYLSDGATMEEDWGWGRHRNVTWINFRKIWASRNNFSAILVSLVVKLNNFDLLRR